MIHWALLAFAVTFALVTFAWATLGSSARPRMVVVLTVLFSGGAFVAAVEVIGQPKPFFLEWRPTAGLEIVGMSPAPDQTAVYVWAMRNGVPISYALPWPDDTEKLAQMLDRFRRRERTGEMFLTTDDGHVAQIVEPPPAEPKQ